MPVPKRRPVPTPKQRAEEDRVMRARRANPPRDPDGTCHEALSELARAIGVDPGDVIDDWDHQSAVYEYEANTSRADAEARALADVRERYTRQARLL